MNKRKQRTLGIFALAVALISTTVAYAALSTTLSISGSVTKKGGTWGIQIVDVSSFTTSGSATTTSTKPTLTGNTSLSFSTSLYKPNDEVSFTFKVKNTGSVDAKIGDEICDGIICSYFWGPTTNTSSGNLLHDSSGMNSKVASYITCQMLYNGVALKSSTMSNLDVKAGATTDSITVKCKYNDQSTISSEDATGSFTVYLPYVQA